MLKELLEFLIDPDYKLFLIIPITLGYYILNMLFGESEGGLGLNKSKTTEFAELIEKIDDAEHPITRAGLYLQFKIIYKGFLKKDFGVIEPRFRDIFIINKLTEQLSFAEIKKLHKLKAISFDNKKSEFFLQASSKIFRRLVLKLIFLISIVVLSFIMLVVFSKFIYPTLKPDIDPLIIKYTYEIVLSLFMVLIYIRCLETISSIVYFKKELPKVLYKLPDHFSWKYETIDNFSNVNHNKHPHKT